MYIDGVGFIHDDLLGGTRPMTRFEVLSQDKEKLAIMLCSWADHTGYNVPFFMKWLDNKWEDCDEKNIEHIKEDDMEMSEDWAEEAW